MPSRTLSAAIHASRLALAAGALLSLAACVNLGGAKAPPQLLTLTAVEQMPPGSQRRAAPAEALVVEAPATDRVLDSIRVPVHVSDSAVAYVKDALWAEKPARLFRQVLAETLAARGDRLVLDEVDTGAERGAILAGTLLRFGYEEGLGAVVVRYDAIVRAPGEPVRKQRFEAIEDVTEVEAVLVGAALNRAANRVAQEVAAWVDG